MGVCAEFVGDIEDVSTVGAEIPHGESVVLEVVVERSFESNVVGHEILTANIKAHAFYLRTEGQDPHRVLSCLFVRKPKYRGRQ